MCATYVILGTKQSLSKLRQPLEIYFTPRIKLLFTFMRHDPGNFLVAVVIYSDNLIDPETVTQRDLLCFFVLLWALLYHSVFSPEISNLGMPQKTCQWGRAFLQRAWWRMEVAMVEMGEGVGEGKGRNQKGCRVKGEMVFSLGMTQTCFCLKTRSQ